MVDRWIGGKGLQAPTMVDSRANRLGRKGYHEFMTETRTRIRRKIEPVWAGEGNGEGGVTGVTGVGGG